MLVYGIKCLIVVVDCFRFLQIGRLASGPNPIKYISDVRRIYEVLDFRSQKTALNVAPDPSLVIF